MQNTSAGQTTKSLIDVLGSADNFESYYNRAVEITKQHFGIARKMFNPIYLSNICLADCHYCGFRVSNKNLERRTLLPDEAIKEASFLRNRGVKNLLLLAGDYRHNKYVEMLKANVRAIKNDIQPDWLGIEVASLETFEYAELKESGVESVYIYQETYDRLRYHELHSTSKYKADYDYRKAAQERAIIGGMKEVGFGVLYGVGHWVNDTIAMAGHALEIVNNYPEVKLNFSFPRLHDSYGQDEQSRTELVTEQQLLKCMVGIRLLFPSANIILTGRESVQFLVDHAKIATVLGFKGSTKVGGYAVNPSTETAQYQMSGDLEYSEFIKMINGRYTSY